jgi:hypothetical protein
MVSLREQCRSGCRPSYRADFVDFAESAPFLRGPEARWRRAVPRRVWVEPVELKGDDLYLFFIVGREGVVSTQ